LQVFPISADLDDDTLDVAPLSGAQRQLIVNAARDAAGPKLALARRMELSALGGSLSAALSTSAST
jgi:hypothetical protein